MKAQIKIEAIGDNSYQFMKFNKGLVNSIVHGIGDSVFGEINPNYWIAEITGFHHKYKYNRNFLQGKKDYSKSNSVGSRGVFIYYLLESGRLYEIKSPISWSKTERYFCIVDSDGNIIKINEKEVCKWINDRLELPY